MALDSVEAPAQVAGNLFSDANCRFVYQHPPDCSVLRPFRVPRVFHRPQQTPLDACLLLESVAESYTPFPHRFNMHSPPAKEACSPRLRQEIATCWPECSSESVWDAPSPPRERRRRGCGVQLPFSGLADKLSPRARKCRKQSSLQLNACTPSPFFAPRASFAAAALPWRPWRAHYPSAPIETF